MDLEELANKIEVPMDSVDAIRKSWDRVRIGSAFVFLCREGEDKGAAAGSAKPGGIVYPRSGRGVNLENVANFPAAALPALSLANVTSDKSLYFAGRDPVRLFALDPLSPGRPVRLSVTCNGSAFATHPASLDGNGCAALVLADLPVGDFRVSFEGAPADAPACEFTVAEYRLAPLVASLVQRQRKGESLEFTLRLRSFGSAVDGPVRLELTDRGRRIAEARAEAKGGLVDGAFALSGEGPHAIHVQLAEDPSRTASVPLVGSRRSERETTVFCPLGTEILGSLLPSPGAVPVRGIFFEEGAATSTPFRVEKLDGSRARITCLANAASVHVSVFDPAARDELAPAPGPEDSPSLLEGLDDAARTDVSKYLSEGDFAFAALLAGHYRIGMGQREKAVEALRQATARGRFRWEDLSFFLDSRILEGFPPFERLRGNGCVTQRAGALGPGRSVEVDVPAPVGILAIGAFVGGKPWEGWAAVVAPEGLAPRVEAPARAEPGSAVRIRVETGPGAPDATVRLVVKDARLLAADTPLSRLAGGIKDCAAAAGKEFLVGEPGVTLKDVVLRQRASRESTGMYFASGLVGAAFPPPPGAAPPPGSRAQWLFDSRRKAEEEMTADFFCAPSSAEPELRAAIPEALAEDTKRLDRPPAPGGRGRAAPAPEPPPDEGRGQKEPEVVFAGVLRARDGIAEVEVRLGDAPADYLVEAFAIRGLQWAAEEARFRAERVPSAELDLPAFVLEGDTALGRVHAACASGRMEVLVRRDGHDLPCVRGEGLLPPGTPLEAREADLFFLASRGAYEAVVRDLVSGASHRCAGKVDEPGKLRAHVRSLRFLRKGEELDLGRFEGGIGLRVLPGLDKPLDALVEATADYGHACCEQTAAKMLAAAAMFLLAGDDGTRRKAESILLAGVRREESMWLRGRGFKMYPERPDQPDDYWGRKAVPHLFLVTLLPCEGASDAWKKGLESVGAMARDAANAYAIGFPPESLDEARDAYLKLRFGKGDRDRSAALRFARERAEGAGGGKPPRPALPGAVGERQEAAYAAAALLRGGERKDLPLALDLANRVVADLNAQGRLYSTVDSTAALVLMLELREAGIAGGAGRARVDGQELSSQDAAARAADARRVECLEGVIPVEVARWLVEDWSAFRSSVRIRVSLESGGKATRRLRAGEAADLVVKLEEGYKPGDLAWVCLPDSLSRVVGGGQVKVFAVDFEGKDEVRVPLAATAATLDRAGSPGRQRFAACVRNMFEEERAGNPGYLEVAVEPPAGTVSPAALALKAFRPLGP